MVLSASGPAPSTATLEGELGGMAMVYLAHDLKHDRQVALKVLKPELAAVLGAERFVQEISLLSPPSSLHSPPSSLLTPHYMSPEQATAEKEITARSDVYSLGSVLDEMLHDARTGPPTS